MAMLLQIQPKNNVPVKLLLIILGLIAYGIWVLS